MTPPPRALLVAVCAAVCATVCAALPAWASPAAAPAPRAAASPASPASPASAAPTAPTAPSAPEVQDITRWLEQRQRDGAAVGVAAALVVDGRVAWMRGLGHADRQAGLAMAPDTPVGIGSVTKTFTALAALQLHDKGVVDIDEPLSRYLPQFRARADGADAQRVTLARLITHSAGVPTDVFRHLDARSATYTDVVELLGDTPLAHPPGTVGLYSNTGYNLLAHALARASGTPYPDLVKREIFAPLAMDGSGFAADRPLPTRPRSRAYGPGGQEATPLDLRDIASGGIHSTAADLSRYAVALMDAYHGDGSTALRPATVRRMFTRQGGITLDTNRKGLGWFLFSHGNTFAAYHAGSTHHANAAVLLIPERRAAAVIVANTVGSDALCEEFAFRWLKAHGLAVSGIVPEPLGPPPAAAAVPRAVHAGFYAQKNAYARVASVEGGLSIRQGGDTVHTVERSPGVFTAPGGDAAADVYYFREVGPYHVLLRRRGEREQQLGYRVDGAPLDAAWAARLGEYSLQGDAMPGFEQLLGATLARQEDGLPVLRVRYNTGTFVYPLLPITRDEARTGGLGPSMTGDAVRFVSGAEGEAMTYLGLWFRRIRP